MVSSTERDVVFLVPARQDLMKLRRKESELKQVITQAQGATARLKYSGAELENLRKKNIVRCQSVGAARRRCSDRSNVPRESPAESHDPFFAPLLQDISRMEKHLAQLESQIQLQQQSVDTKSAAMNQIRDQIIQVLSPHL